LIDPTNAEELATIAGEIGADVLEGALRYPSDSGEWLLGDLDVLQRSLSCQGSSAQACSVV
jgi:hypothetical protein